MEDSEQGVTHCRSSKGQRPGAVLFAVFKEESAGKGGGLRWFQGQPMGESQVTWHPLPLWGPGRDLASVVEAWHLLEGFNLRRNDRIYTGTLD